MCLFRSPDCPNDFSHTSHSKRFSRMCFVLLCLFCVKKRGGEDKKGREKMGRKGETKGRGKKGEGKEERKKREREENRGRNKGIPIQVAFRGKFVIAHLAYELLGRVREGMSLEVAF